MYKSRREEDDTMEMYNKVYGRSKDDGIRIIQHGDLSLLRKFKRFTCNKCGCIWEADKNHYKYSGNQLDGDSYCCDCPTCGAATYDR